MYKVIKIEILHRIFNLQKAILHRNYGGIFEELQEAFCLYISFHLSMQGVEFFK